MGRSITFSGVLLVCGLAALGACDAGPSRDTASTQVQDWMTCPDEVVTPLRADGDEDMATLRTARPTANGAQDPALYATVRHLPHMYAMYDVFDADGDPESAFPADTLTLNALIMGSPGRDTERPRAVARAQTLYGFWATDQESGTDLIVIRGTMTPLEWVRNIQATQRDLPNTENGARVHKGFLEIYDSFTLDRGPHEGAFLDAVRNGAFRGRAVMVTGHSLGGALAALTATDLARLDETAPTSLITVAAPRVGNAAFRDLAGAIGSAVRLCNMPDLVTMVPPSIERIRYVHVGEPRRYSSFDHDAALHNDLEDTGSQILCWHSIDTYTWMLDETYQTRFNPQCWTEAN